MQAECMDDNMQIAPEAGETFFHTTFNGCFHFPPQLCDDSTNFNLPLLIVRLLCESWNFHFVIVA